MTWIYIKIQRKLWAIIRALLMTVFGISFVLFGKFLVIHFQVAYADVLRYASYCITFILSWLLVYIIVYETGKETEKIDEDETDK